MKKKPGVMVYFELRGMMKLLSDAEKGKLFEAILEYGETGRVGELTDRLRVAWPLIKMRLDMDNNRYELTVTKRRYAAYTRWAKEHGEKIQSFHEWAGIPQFDEEDDPLLYS